LADLRQERAMTNLMRTLRDGQGKFAHTLEDWRQIEEASKECTAEVKKIEKEKKEILSELESFKKVFTARFYGTNIFHRVESRVCRLSYQYISTK
jgi:hypothetical protein